MTTATRARRPYAARVPIEVRREQLLDAALAIIHRDGYAAVSVEAIAREAGVTRPVVYGAYDGLGPLLTALLDREQVKAFARLLSVVPAEFDRTDPVALATEVVGQLVAMANEDPATWRTIVMRPEGLPQAVRERIEADRTRIVHVFGRLAVDLMPPGVWDREALGHAIVAVFESFGRLVLDEPDQWPAERLIDALRPVLRMLLPRRPD